MFLLVSLSLSDRLCNEIKLVQTSLLYNPSEIYIKIDEGGRYLIGESLGWLWEIMKWAGKV